MDEKDNYYIENKPQYSDVIPSDIVDKLQRIERYCKHTIDYSTEKLATGVSNDQQGIYYTRRLLAQHILRMLNDE